MQARRPSPLTPLAIVLPHPPLPRRSSSSSLSAPRTPTTRTPPLASSAFLIPVANRNSTDSWNSSNQDDPEFDWKQEQTLLLARTLDALPAHLLTPFNGVIPPSNLLDKIARGVANAKGPLEWPHSIRATRVKLMELARIRAREATQDQNYRIIIEEDDDSYSPAEVLQQTTNTVPTRPLYRQSSMDFMNSAKTDLNSNDNIARLSNRLQRTDKVIPNPAYHPYSRPSLQCSPRSESRQEPLSSSLLNPHSATCSALNSSTPSHPRLLRRSMSTLSSSSDQYLPSLSELAEISRMQRVRRLDGIGATPPNTVTKPRQPLKRVPTFGAVARPAPNSDFSSLSSSDEEEKIRTKQAKKLRTKNCNTATPPPPTPIKTRTKTKETNAISTSSVLSLKSSTGSSSSKCSSTATSGSSSTALTTVASVSSRPAKLRPKMNLQRNPSMFGEELPHPQTPVAPPRRIRHSPPPIKPTAQPSVAPTSSPAPITVTTISSPPRTLRRVRAMSFARAPARRISFGSVPAPPEGECGVSASPHGLGLGSAFQLR